MSTGRIQFELRAGHLGPEELAVSRVEGHEGLSEPYAFAVEFVLRSGERVELEELLGQESELTLRRNTGEERVVHGECHRIELTGVAAGVPGYRLTIRPRLSRLKRVARSRIFQGKSVPEIVASVLKEHGVANRSALSGSYSAREYTVQYRESDLAFVSRLLEGEGIWYRFEHAAGSHELVLGDAPSGYVDAPAEVPFKFQSGQATESEFVHRLERECRVVPGEVETREYDFERPAVEQKTTASAEKGLQIYEPSSGKQDGSDPKERAKRRLEGLRHGTESFEGKGNALAFVPGTAIQLEGRERLLAVRVKHDGAQELSAGSAGERTASYENAFEAIDAGRAYRPKRSTPLPLIRGIQSARVVGPPGEEIHVDRWGRIKVQFRWDRDGKQDDRSSCWVRTGQAWAGPGMGSQFVPRIGQEVVVRFLDGNPDRPLVTGAIFNGENPAAVALPQDKTRSTTRTQSSPGGDGYNELTFEDQAGQEELHLRAQRDENVRVEDAHGARVRANERISVAKDRTKRVLGSQTLSVGKEDGAGVGGMKVLTVAGSRETQVGGSQTEQVGLAQAVTVGGAQDVTVARGTVVAIGAAAALNVGGGYAINVGGAINEAVAGLKSSQVGGEAVVIVGAHSEERVAKERTSTTNGDAQFGVDGAVRTIVDGNVTDTVDGKVTLRAADLFGGNFLNGTMKADKINIVVGGKLLLSLEKSGALQFLGKTLTVDGKQLKLKGGKIKKVAAGGAAQVTVAAAQLAKQEGVDRIEVEIVDALGNPAPMEPVHVERDGVEKDLKADSEGRLLVLVPKGKSAKAGFPRLDEEKDGGETAKGEEKKVAGAVKAEAGKTVQLKVGKKNVIQLPVRRDVMTIAFLLPSAPEGEYPKFVLESDDGTFRVEKGPKDDLVKGNETLDLGFEGLRPGRRYRLTRHDGPDEEVLVFEGLPYAAVVDQPEPAAGERGASGGMGRLETGFEVPERSDEGTEP